MSELSNRVVALDPREPPVTTCLTIMGAGRVDLRVVLLGVAIAVGHTLFTLATLPQSTQGLPGLWITPAVAHIISDTLSHNWPRLLLPFEFEPNRGGVYWQPSSILLLYAVQTYMGALTSYLVFSNIFIVISGSVGWWYTKSTSFTATLMIAFGFGTQLDYSYAYGWLIVIYILLSLCVVNVFIIMRLLSDSAAGISWRIAFVASLAVVALAGEWWLNYAVALIAACLFGMMWASRHQRSQLRSSLLFVLWASLAVLATYLAIRLPFHGNFLKAGSEEELAVTYSNKILMAEDVIANFFTFLYSALTNYLPSFLTSSNSLTYLDPTTIIAEQHGYDAPHQNLVLMNHLFLWRFYAGMAAAIFIGFCGFALHKAWNTSSTSAAWIAALAIMVITGFATHIIIKFRPYNSVPALPYKAIFSISAWTVLLAYLTMISEHFFRSKRAFHALLGGVWGCILLAAVTRPGMEKHLLSAVGLIGLRDPLAQILSSHW